MAVHIDGNFSWCDTNAESLKSLHNQLSLCALDAIKLDLQARIEAYDHPAWYSGCVWSPVLLRLIVTNKAGGERRVYSMYDWSIQAKSAEFKRWRAQ